MEIASTAFPLSSFVAPGVVIGVFDHPKKAMLAPPLLVYVVLRSLIFIVAEVMADSPSPVVTSSALRV